ISSAIERIGDYATNVAEPTRALVHMPPLQAVHTILDKGRLVQAKFESGRAPYDEHDSASPLRGRERAEEGDELYTRRSRELLTYMMEDPRSITPCTHLLFIAKNIERIGDHATNIAETVYFLVHGKPLEGMRPKGDNSNFAVVTPGSGGTPGDGA